LSQDTFCFELVDTGDGPVQYVTADPAGLKAALGLAEERRVEVVPLEEFVAIGEGEQLPEDEVAGLCCPMDNGPWKGSDCEVWTGWSEEEVRQELAKIDLLSEIKRLRDEGVI